MTVTPTFRSSDAGVRLHVNLPGIVDAEQAKEIVTDTQKVCPCSRATRGNIDVEMTANGEPV